MVVACNSIRQHNDSHRSSGYTIFWLHNNKLCLHNIVSINIIFCIYYLIYYLPYLFNIYSDNSFWYTRVFRQPSNSIHSSQFHGLWSTKSSNEMLQNLPYLYITKTHTYVLSFFNSMLYSIFPIYEFPKSQNSQNRHRQQCKQGKEIKEIFNPFVGTFHKTKILKLGRVPCPK